MEGPRFIFLSAVLMLWIGCASPIHGATWDPPQEPQDERPVDFQAIYRPSMVEFEYKRIQPWHWRYEGEDFFGCPVWRNTLLTSTWTYFQDELDIGKRGRWQGLQA